MSLPPIQPTESKTSSIIVSRKRTPNDFGMEHQDMITQSNDIDQWRWRHSGGRRAIASERPKERQYFVCAARSLFGCTATYHVTFEDHQDQTGTTSITDNQHNHTPPKKIKTHKEVWRKAKMMAAAEEHPSVIESKLRSESLVQEGEAMPTKRQIQNLAYRVKRRRIASG